MFLKEAFYDHQKITMLNIILFEYIWICNLYNKYVIYGKVEFSAVIITLKEAHDPSEIILILENSYGA